jgi:hypothetical protein
MLLFAGAIASIAFNQPVALVDGNVVRVFSRLRAVAADAKSKSLAKLCWLGLFCREIAPIPTRQGRFLVFFFFLHAGTSLRSSWIRHDLVILIR